VSASTPVLLLIRGGVKGISPQLLLRLVDQTLQIPKQLLNHWRLLRVPGGIESKHRETGRDLLQGEQGALQHFGGKGTSGQGGHWSDATALRVPRGGGNGLCETA